MLKSPSQLGRKTKQKRFTVSFSDSAKYQSPRTSKDEAVSGCNCRTFRCTSLLKMGLIGQKQKPMWLMRSVIWLKYGSFSAVTALKPKRDCPFLIMIASSAVIPSVIASNLYNDK